MKRITRFFAGAFAELRKVKWPSFDKVVRHTSAVIFMLVFFSLFSMGVRYVIAFIIKAVG